MIILAQTNTKILKKNFLLKCMTYCENFGKKNKKL